jgi:dephospho-CoA kinase
MTKRVVGLTGGIGAGKSTAAEMLRELGAVVIDCDQLGRDVSEPSGAAYPALVERFGPGIVGPDQRIDRRALAAVVFDDQHELAALNAITHPAIDAEIESRIEAAPPASLVVLDMAVLVESELGAGLYQEVLVIESPLEQRLERMRVQRQMGADDAAARIASQASDSQRRAVADHVIVNDGDLGRLRAALEAWLGR